MLLVPLRVGVRPRPEGPCEFPRRPGLGDVAFLGPVRDTAVVSPRLPAATRPAKAARPEPPLAEEAAAVPARPSSLLRGPLRPPIRVIDGLAARDAPTFGLAVPTDVGTPGVPPP